MPVYSTDVLRRGWGGVDSRHNMIVEAIVVPEIIVALFLPYIVHMWYTVNIKRTGTHK